MDSTNQTDSYEDNRDAPQSRQSLQSTKKYSRESSVQSHKKNIRHVIQDEGVESRSKTRTWLSDPDRDRVSDREERRSSRSFYSDDYENDSRSEDSVSSYSRSRTPSPSLQRQRRAKGVSSNPTLKTGGVGRRGVSRPTRPGAQPLLYRRGVRSQSKDCTPPKDLDLVTKKVLSARLLKISELQNALAELQQHTEELQKENRVLRQLQVRQEKALRRYNDTDSEISQLLSRHNNETHVLRERLRRTQERERAAERRWKDSEEQLHRSQATIARLKKLVDQRELGARDELSRRLEEEKARSQEAERKVKELERNLELSTNSFQRQLAAEKKKTVSAQEEIRILQEELERMTNKLREKERELDTKNIYANRMMKPSIRKDIDVSTKRKASSRNSTKDLQNKDQISSLGFPTPPPAVADASVFTEQAPDEYLSLQELDRMDRPALAEDRQQKCEEQKSVGRQRDEQQLEKEKDRKEHVNHELNVLEEKAKRPRDDREKEKEKEEEDRKRTSSLLNQDEESNMKHGHVQEEIRKWNQDTLANHQAAEEARRKKDQLLAKMREIDRQNHNALDSTFAESSPFESSKGNFSSPRPPEQRNQNPSIFSLTETEETSSAGSRDGGPRRLGLEGGAAVTGAGRRALRSQNSSDGLAFGNYSPSFKSPASRGSAGFPPPPPMEDRDSALEAIGVFTLRGVETGKEKETERVAAKDRKSNLMEQLFGPLVTPAGDGFSASNKMEVLNCPSNTNGMRPRRERLLSFSSGSPTPPASSVNTLQVAESRPAVRAITSFDDDIEELTL